MLFFKCLHKADFKQQLRQVLNLELQCNGINYFLYCEWQRLHERSQENLTPEFSFNRCNAATLNREVQTTGKNYGLYYEKGAAFQL